MDWFYAQEGRQIGPISEADFPQLLKDGAITPETLVWHAGMGDWQPYGQALGIPPLPGAGAAPADGAQRFCSACGKSFAVSDLAFFGESAVCAWCKPAYVQRLRQGMTTTSDRQLVYAGFWIRALAQIIDGVILGVARWIVFIPMGIGFIARPSDPGFSAGSVAMAALFSLVVNIVYFIFFWTRYGATPGKMILRLKLVTPQGGPITTGQAVGRYFAQWLSGLILGIGFMMAGWDSEKRALHDRLAETRVIKTE